MTTADPFGTAGLRAAVLDAWQASPARFREDANSEEDLVVGGYRDRLLVELAQNAADAARLSGTEGRLRVELTLSPSPQLLISNTGAPLDAEGVIGLSTLRASGKRHGDTIGRFGVGFAAVLAVSDSPEVRSRDGGVRFSLAESAELARSLPDLTPELERRSFRPPVLRLPFPSATPPEPGFDTTVVLPLRDLTAVEAVAAALREADEALLLVLEPLTEATFAMPDPRGSGMLERRFRLTREESSAVVVTETRSAEGARESRTEWLLERRTGVLGVELLATLPTEERNRERWDVLWALPVAEAASQRDQSASWSLAGGGEGIGGGVAGDGGVSGDGGKPGYVVHAPTPTDEALSLPALLVASLPLQPDRRHVLPGPVTERVLEEAAAAYVALAVRVGEPRLVPTGFPVGAVDGRLHELVRDRLRDARVVAGQRPGDVVWVPGLGDDVLAHLRPELPELVGPPWSRTARALRALEVPERGVADVVDALASVRAEPQWWARLYALLDTDGVSRDELGALPVPLLDGRLVRGARGVLLPSESLPAGVDPELLAELSLRVAHPDAVAASGAARLLTRLGATETDAATLLRDPAVAAALSRADDEGDEAELLRLARLVLALLGASPTLTQQPGLALAELPWLSELELPDADGELRFADELALPDSPLLSLAPDDLGVVDVDALAGDALGGNALRDVLVAAGVRDSFPVVLLRELSVDADEAELPAPVAALDDVTGWLDHLAVAHSGAIVVRAQALADLDLIVDEDWPQAFELLGSRRETLDAVLAPAELQAADGSHTTASSYATWWLSRHALLAGRPPSRWSTGEDPLLTRLLPRVPVALDPALQRALGVRTTLSALLSEPGGPEAVLELLAEVDVAPQVLGAVMARLAALPGNGGRGEALLPEPPELLRAVVGDATAVVAAEDVVVVDRPDLLPVVVAAEAPHLRVPLGLAGPLAALLELDVASEHWPEREGAARGWKPEARQSADVAPEDGSAALSEEGRRVPVPAWELLARLLPGEDAQLLPGADAQLPREWWEHHELRWHGVEVEWRVLDGQVHATTLAGLARGLAWVAGRWDLRFVMLELLVDPGSAATVLAEADLDSP